MCKEQHVLAFGKPRFDLEEEVVVAPVAVSRSFY